MSEPNPEPAAANAAMRRYWNEVAGPRWVGLGGAQEARNVEVARMLLEAAAVQPGERVLDVGCGTGATLIPFAAAVGPQGHATGVDIAAPMLERARERVAEQGLTNVTLLQADAQVHGFAPASFDMVTSRFGVMFFADPTAAFRNLYGALRPGGRLCMAVWAAVAENVHRRIPLEIAVRLLGPPSPQPPHTPDAQVFADLDYFRGVLTAAGFADIAIEPKRFHVVGASVSGMADNVVLFGAIQRLLDEKHADAATRQRIVKETEAAFAAYATPSGEIRLPGTFLLATARRPT
ncbi:MAG TPA: methyltransferase domain-containing protein [Stellaceae bacterium]|nr:methyltransferase domain-containing protein [Stellaceae bacterium]